MNFTSIIFDNIFNNIFKYSKKTKNKKSFLWSAIKIFDLLYSINRSCVNASSGNGIDCSKRPKCGLQSSNDDLDETFDIDLSFSLLFTLFVTFSCSKLIEIQFLLHKLGTFLCLRIDNYETKIRNIFIHSNQSRFVLFSIFEEIINCCKTYGNKIRKNTRKRADHRRTMYSTRIIISLNLSKTKKPRTVR